MLIKQTLISGLYFNARNKIKRIALPVTAWCDKHKFVWAEVRYLKNGLKNDRRHERRSKELSLWSVLFNYRTYKRWVGIPTRVSCHGGHYVVDKPDIELIDAGTEAMETKKIFNFFNTEKTDDGVKYESVDNVIKFDFDGKS